MPRLTWATWGIAFITLGLTGTATGQERAGRLAERSRGVSKSDPCVSEPQPGDARAG